MASFLASGDDPAVTVQSSSCSQDTGRANKGNLRAVLSFERLHFSDQISCQYREQGPDVNQDNGWAPSNVGPSVRLDIYSEI